MRQTTLPRILTLNQTILMMRIRRPVACFPLPCAPSKPLLGFSCSCGILAVQKYATMCPDTDLGCLSQYFAARGSLQWMDDDVNVLDCELSFLVHFSTLHLLQEVSHLPRRKTTCKKISSSIPRDCPHLEPSSVEVSTIASSHPTRRSLIGARESV